MHKFFNTWIPFILIIIFLDQCAKALAKSFLILNQPYILLPFFNLTLRYNTGAAFSLFAKPEGQQNWFLLSFTLLILCTLFYLLFKASKNADKTAQYAYLCIIGGALGNIYDRIHLGHVIDFLEFHIQKWYWPTFNLADTAICIGIGILLLFSFKKEINTQNV